MRKVRLIACIAGIAASGTAIAQVQQTPPGAGSAASSGSIAGSASAGGSFGTGFARTNSSAGNQSYGTSNVTHGSFLGLGPNLYNVNTSSGSGGGTTGNSASLGNGAGFAGGFQGGFGNGSGHANNGQQPPPVVITNIPR